MADTFLEFNSVVKFTLDPVAVEAWMVNPAGDVARYLRVMGVESKKAASKLAKQRLSKGTAPRAKSGTFNGQARDWNRSANYDGVPAKRTGDYDKNFRVKSFRYKSGLAMSLTNISKYAMAVEEGVKGGYKISHRDGGRLSFHNGGFSAPGEAVFHPGYKGKFILSDALKAAIAIQYTIPIPNIKF